MIESSHFDGFMDQAKKHGIDQESATAIYKQAMAELGAQPVAAPEEPSEEEIMQIIQSLPPEEQEAIIQELLMSVQGDGAGVPHPQEEILAKQAEYIEGFVERASEYKLDKKAAVSIYLDMLDDIQKGEI